MAFTHLLQRHYYSTLLLLHAKHIFFLLACFFRDSPPVRMDGLSLSVRTDMHAQGQKNIVLPYPLHKGRFFFLRNISETHDFSKMTSANFLLFSSWQHCHVVRFSLAHLCFAAAYLQPKKGLSLSLSPNPFPNGSPPSSSLQYSLSSSSSLDPPLSSIVVYLPRWMMPPPSSLHFCLGATGCVQVRRPGLKGGKRKRAILPFPVGRRGGDRVRWREWSVCSSSLYARILWLQGRRREKGGDRDRRRRMLSEVLNWVKTLIPHHRASYSCPSPSLFLLLIFHNASFFPSLQSSISAAAWKKTPFVGWGETPPL